MKKNNHTLLFGSTGFISSSFLLKNKNSSIISLDKKSFFKTNTENYKFKKIDLSSKKINFSKYIFKNNFKGAIITSYNIYFKNRNKKDYINENLRIIKNCLKICKINNINRIIYMSSPAVYGTQNKKIKENSARKPINIYGKSKCLTEDMVKKFSRLNKLDYCIFRLFHTYGFNENNIICRFINMDKNNIPIKINGKGDQIRDFTYIDDVVVALNKSLNYKKKINKVLNLCSGKQISMKKIIMKITKNFIHTDPIPEPKLLIGSNNLLKKTLNWQPKTNFDQGLLKLKKSFK